MSMKQRLHLWRTHNIVVRILLILLLTNILAACTTASKISSPAMGTPEQYYQSRQQQLQTLQHWQLRARIGIRTEQDAGSATLLWKQTPQQLDLRLRGPLGTQLISISGSGQNYRLLDRQGQQWQANNIDQLITKHSGWSLPVSQLRYWILGISARTDANSIAPDEQRQLNADGTLAVLQHQAWRIQYQRYKQYGIYRLPDKITVYHPDITIKIIIKHWTYD